MQGDRKRFHRRWKKYLLTVLVLAIVLAVWSIADSLLIVNAADERAMAEEERLWKTIFDIDSDYGKYVRATLQAREQLFADNDGDSSAGGNGEQITADNKRSAAALSALRGIVSRHEELLRRRRAQIESIADNPDAGYRDDVFMLHALAVRSFIWHRTALETMLYNAGKQRAMPGKTFAPGDLYQLYCQDNKGREFIYPDYVGGIDGDAASSAIVDVERWCHQNHGGFCLWMGSPEEAVRSDFASFVGNDLIFYHAGYLQKLARARCVDLRRQHGSLLSSFRRQLMLWSDGLYMRGAAAAINCLHSWDEQDGDSSVLPLPVYKNFRSGDDRVWSTAHYLLLSTDNFLWKIKYQESGDKNSDFMEQCRIREIYGKDSAPMRQYRGCLAADLQSCRRKLDSAESQSSPAMRQAALELGKSTEAVLSIWDSYCQGKIDYRTFAAELKKEESSLEMRKHAVYSARWDSLSQNSLGIGYYVMRVMATEGVPEKTVKRLAKEKG